MREGGNLTTFSKKDKIRGSAFCLMCLMSLHQREQLENTGKIKVNMSGLKTKLLLKNTSAQTKILT